MSALMVNYNSKERQNMHFYGKFCSFIIIATSSEQGFRAKLTKANLLRRVHQTLFSDLFSLKMRLLEAFIQYYICLFSLSLYLSLSLSPGVRLSEHTRPCNVHVHLCRYMCLFCSLWGSSVNHLDFKGCSCIGTTK